MPWREHLVDDRRSFIEMIVPVTTGDAANGCIELEAAGWRRKVVELDEMVPHLADLLGPDLGAQGRGMCHLTRKAPPRDTWAPRNASRSSLTLHHTELAAFEGGAGLLVLHFVPADEKVTLAEWMSCVRAARFVDDKRSIVRTASACRPAPYLRDLLPSGWLIGDPDSWPTGRAYVYSATFVDALETAEVDDVLGRLRRHIAAEAVLEPSLTATGSGGDGVLQNSTRQKAANQWFSASLTHVVYLAHGLPSSNSYYRDNLPKELRDLYQLMLLLCLHQRLGLIRLTRDVFLTYSKMAGPDRLRRFDELRTDMLGLSATGIFTQVTNRESFHAYYSHLRTVLEIDELHREVRHEITDIHERLTFEMAREANELAERDAERRRGFERLVALLGVAFAVSSLAVGFLGINMKGWTGGAGLPFATACAVAAGALLVGLAFGGVISLVAGRKRTT